LLREVLNRVDSVLDEEARWKLLLDAFLTMAADLSLDGVLHRIVEVAGRLVGAQYAALGVLSEGPERRLRTFVHNGLPEGLAETIGELPTGHGLLGLIIDRPEPVRLSDIAAHPASYGFPDGHPPMSSFLGVPVRIRDKVFGNLYLTEKKGGGDFTDKEQDVVVALAAAAGVAIENARLYEEAARRERWLAATAEITRLLSGETSGAEALQVVADRGRELAGADIAWVVAGDHPSELSLRVVSGGEADFEELTANRLDRSISAEVARTAIPLQVENVSADPRFVMPSATGWPELGPAIFVPLGNSSGTDGVLVLAWSPENAESFYEVDAGLPAAFAEQAALALQVAKHRDGEQRLAVFEDRDRIGRDLHDLVIQRLFAVGLGLQSLGRMVDRPAVAERLEAAVDDLDTTIKDIRMTIFELSSMADASDIQSEVRRMAERSAGAFGFEPTVRFQGPVRTAVSSEVAPHLLAVLGEGLSNAARHAQASSMSVVLIAGRDILLELADNGCGMPPDAVESGLRNMRERAERLGGSCEIVSAPGEGTMLRWVVPAR
jgi:signal transduction histidine kinase